MKVVMLIITCEKYSHKAKYQKTSWIPSLPDNISYYHIIGSKDKCGRSDYLFDHTNHILYTNTKDDYVSLPDKVITAIYAVTNELTFDYIYKVDDDMVLTKPSFFEKLETMIDSYDYGGHLVHVNDHYSEHHIFHSELKPNLLLEKASYCGGPFYFLSKKSIRYLLEKKLFLSSKIIEDHAVGRILSMDHNDVCILQLEHMIKDSFINYDMIYKYSSIY
jgi:hypothetical protein